jgi:hypothetical protein
MCAVPSALGRPASESGRLRHRDGGHEGGDRRRTVLMLAILRPASESGRLRHGEGSRRWGGRRRRVLVLAILRRRVLVLAILVGICWQQFTDRTRTAPRGIADAMPVS